MGWSLVLTARNFSVNGCHQLLIQSQNHLCWFQNHEALILHSFLPVKLPWPPQHPKEERGVGRGVQGRGREGRRKGNPFHQAPNRPSTLGLLFLTPFQYVFYILYCTTSNMYSTYCAVKLPSNLRTLLLKTLCDF